MDHENVPEEARQLFENEETIKTTSLDEIKTMLTYCVRVERFCNGNWGSMVEEGYVRQILERLIALRQQMDENPET